MTLANWRPTEDAEGRPGTALWSASLRLHTMEEGLGENRKRSLCLGRLYLLVMPAQPAPGERRHKYKAHAARISTPNDIVVKKEAQSSMRDWGKR